MTIAMKSEAAIKRKKQIISVAEKLCRQNGLQKLSLRAVAKEVGISAPSIYEYFKSKDELVATLRDIGRAELTKALGNSVNDTLSVRERIYHMILAYIKFADNQTDTFQLLFSLPTGRSSINVAPDTDSPYFLLVQACAEALSTGQIIDTVKDEEKMAFQLWSMMHGAATLKITILKDSNFELEPFIEAAIEQSLDGLFKNN